MTEHISLSKSERHAQEELQELLSLNVEQFRVDAATAHRLFTPHDRKIINDLKYKGSREHLFFEYWNSDIRVPLRIVKRPVQGAFIRSLSSALALNDQDAKQLAESLIETREDELVNRLVQNVYGDSMRKGTIQLVTDVLSWSEDDIEALYKRHSNCTAYDVIAKNNHISVYDPHASWLKRQRVSVRIRKENRDLLESENSKLHEIQHLLQDLYSRDDDLIRRIKATGIDIVTIFAAKAEYDKRLQKVSEEDRQNPVVCTDIYTKVTTKLRRAIGEKYDNKLTTLSESRKVVNDIDTVLVRVFDLSSVKKNQLMADMKTVRELLREKESIETIQQARLKVAKRTLWK